MQIRRSRQRERVLEFLKNTDLHPSADAIYLALKTEMPDLSLGTVYRNLNQLCDQGLIKKITSSDGQNHFDAEKKLHYHCICETCGSVMDINLPMFESINEAAENICNFKVSRHNIDFFGTCESCQMESQH